MKLFKFIRRHPKKTLFFSSILGLGANYFYKKHEDDLLLGSYCAEALKYGEELISVGEKERHITVIQNPTANNGKCKAQYTKYCAPLLHLAGLKVTYVRTEYEGQARDIADVVTDSTDGILVAGGDGLLSEVLTGLFRRQKPQPKWVPLSIVPLGDRNSAAAAIWGFRGKGGTREICDATMALVRDVRSSLDLMEVTQLEGGADAKSVYAATELEWGALREARERRDKYWYWGSLKKYVTYVFSSYKDLTWNCDADLEWSLPCSGCNRCVVEVVPKIESKRWWHAFLPKKANVEESKIDYSKIINEECGKMHSSTIENVSDLRISTRNTHLTEDMPGNVLALKIGPKNVGCIDFIKEGWNEENHEEPNVSVQHVGSIILKPIIKTNENEDDKQREFGIDGESFEIKAVRIRALPKAITIFGPGQDFFRK